MHKFARSLITEWRRLGLPFDDATVVAAVSGGADSVSLLLAMHDLVGRKKLKLRLVAAHFNHNLRHEESHADERYVREMCIRLGVELAVGHGKISADGNLEQNARDARYAFLSETASKLNAFAVLTGHTINDQAETFLLNLVRGSGPDGLSGMRPVRQFENSPRLLVRPLLTWAKRRETEGFCRDMGIEYRYDTMNEDTAFKRVRIRKILLPVLEDMNPNIVETLANTAALMQQIPAQEPMDGGGHLKLNELAMLSQGELYDTIREWLRANRGDLRSIQLKHIEAIARLVKSGKSGKMTELPAGACVVKSGGRLTYDKNKVEN